MFLVVSDQRCLVSMWSEWSSCINATCDRSGMETRTRMYADKKAAMAGSCSENLKESRTCTIDCNNDPSKKKDKQTMMSSMGSFKQFNGTNIDVDRQLSSMF
jgi:hypothetical protein